MVIIASGAPTGAAATNPGVIFLSVATGGVYVCTGVGNTTSGACVLVTTGTAY